MRWLFYNLIGLCLLPLATAFGVILIRLLDHAVPDRNLFLSFGIGMLGYGIFFVSCGRKKWGAFFEVLEHELTHMIFALLFFKSIGEFQASARSGKITYGSNSNSIITLGPYFFPLTPMILISLRPILVPAVLSYFDITLGFFWMFHYLALIRHFSFDQPDLQQYPAMYIIAVIVGGNIITIGLFLALFLDGYAGGWQFLVDGCQLLIHWMETLYHELVASGML